LIDLKISHSIWPCSGDIAICKAEGATASETLRQKNRYTDWHSGEKPMGSPKG